MWLENREPEVIGGGSGTLAGCFDCPLDMGSDMYSIYTEFLVPPTPGFIPSTTPHQLVSLPPDD